MSNIFPGVVEVQGQVTGAEHAARHAVELAHAASRHGTFGVGGFLMRSDGRIVAEAFNKVIVEGQVDDPTAHVERQLVDWYLAKDGALDLLPDDLILVSSLDPCAMCAAAILSAGFRAVAVAEDPVSGVHSCGLAHQVPPTLEVQARRALHLFNTPGRQIVREDDAGWLAKPIAREVVDGAESAFSASLAAVRTLIATIDERETGMPDLDILRRDPALGLDPNVMIAGDDPPLSADPGRSLLIDRSGRVLLRARAASPSPTRSGIVELVRAYSRLRRYARTRHMLHLPHQRTCSIVSCGTGLDDVSAMLALGAVGSALEGRSEVSPVLGFTDPRAAAKVRDALRHLPPLYNEVLAISVGQVGDRGATGDRSDQSGRALAVR